MTLPLSLSPSITNSSSSSSSPTSITLSLLPLLSILSHHQRRPSTSNDDRTFGTLFGVRNSSTGHITVRTAVGHPFSVLENGKVQYDVQNIVEAETDVARTSKEEVIVGWFATHPRLNSFSSLIHNLYEQRAHAPVVHLTLDPDTLAIKAYSSALIGAGGRFGTLRGEKTDRSFTPIAWNLQEGTLDSTALSLLLSPSPSTSSPSPATQTQTQSLSDLLSDLLSLLSTVQSHVDSVVSGQTAGDPRVARELLGVLGTSSGAGEERWSEELEGHKATVLTLSWISSVTLALSEAANRLALTNVPA